MADDDFDLSRLTPWEREVWDRYFADSRDSLAIRLWGFGHACMLECEGIPVVAAEKLNELDPDHLIKQYVENVRRARWDRGQ